MLDEYMKKVDKVVIILLAITTCSATVIYSLGVINTLVPTISAGLSVIISTTLIKLDVNRKIIRKILFIFIAIILVAFMKDCPQIAVEYGAIGICVSTFYFKKNYEMLCSFVVAIGVVYIGFTTDVLIQREIILGIIAIIFIAVILYFVSKWGYENIIEVKEKEEKSTELLNEIENTMKIVNENTEVLDDNINTCNENFHVINLTSDSINKTLEDVTKGIAVQTSGLSNINDMVTNISKRIDEVSNQSKELSNISQSADNIVLEGYNNINDMDYQMKIINQVSEKSFSTIKDLVKSIEEISNFLLSISEISQQTNLLALNASIEASRAGEAGKGFAVVAEEIKVLASESDRSVNQINSILTTIQRETKNVLDEAENETQAVSKGREIITNVTSSFEEIRKSFKTIDENILEEVDKINNVVKVFENVRKEINSVAEISEEHNASTEELMFTTQENNKNIKIAYDSMKNIKESSSELKSIVHA